jgi:predicted metal-dependent hydrolase
MDKGMGKIKTWRVMFRQLRKPSDLLKELLFFRETRVEVRRRSFKRSIGVTLQVNGRIQVSAPRTASLHKIKEFLEIHGEWISLNMRKYEELRSRYPRKRFSEGEPFLFLGEALPLKFVPWSGQNPRVKKNVDELWFEIPRAGWQQFNPAAAHPELATAMVSFYERAGRALLLERVRVYSERMQLFPTALSFRSQKTRWGSCSSQGRLSLNWRLVVAPLAVVDYVVVHELAHLRYYNHSQAFWALVSNQRPDYRELRDWLKRHQYEADFLARQSELHPFERPKRSRRDENGRNA